MDGTTCCLQLFYFREGGDIGLFITLVHKLLYQRFHIRWGFIGYMGKHRSIGSAGLRPPLGLDITKNLPSPAFICFIFDCFCSILIYFQKIKMDVADGAVISKSITASVQLGNVAVLLPQENGDKCHSFWLTYSIDVILERKGRGTETLQKRDGVYSIS